LKAQYDESLSNFAFNFYLRRYTTVVMAAWLGDQGGSGNITIHFPDDRDRQARAHTRSLFGSS
jgi:hypothetical protein